MTINIDRNAYKTNFYWTLVNGYLKYVVENCKTAFDELCKTNKELNIGMNQESNADINHLGAMNRMIQDYLVIRVAGLFDKDNRTISFNTAFPKNQEVESMEREEIIKKIVENMAADKLVKLTLRDDAPVYEIDGSKDHKLLGIIPVTTKATLFVSAESGKAVAKKQSALASVVDFLSPKKKK